MRHNTQLALACAIALCGLSSAQAADKQTASANIPVVTDWSSRSVVYHDLKTPDQFAATGRSAEMAQAYRDPRYVAAILRKMEADAPQPAARGMSRQATVAAAAAATTCDRRLGGPCTGTPQAPAADDSNYDITRDWSNVLGGGTNGQGGSGMEGVFPAKYRFDITAPVSSANCATDFVVYPTNAAGAAQSNGATQETWVYTFSGNATANQTFIVGPAGPRQVVLIASTSQNTGKYFQTANNDNARAANLRAAINRWSGQTGFVADAATNAVVTVRSLTTGDITDSYVTSNLSNVTGPGGFHGTGTTAGQPTIIAFNQLYNTTCDASRDNANAPNVMWSYNTGANYVVETSPVLSWHDDGRQVAFVQRNGNTLQLVLLKWAALANSADRQAAAANPTALTPVSNTAYSAARSGTAAAMHVITLNGTTNTGSTPTYSSPFVDYIKDELWVGDGNGRLHKITGVFQGVPTEVTTGGFPVTVAAGMKLSSPVHYKGNVYIGSQSGAGDLGGRLHRISAASGAKFDSAKLSIANAIGLREMPIATDTPVGTGSIFAFLFNDGTAGNDTDCAPTDNNRDSCRVVARFTPGFAADAEPNERAYVGRGNNINSTLYAGAFDDAYYNSSNGTGAMYIVGGEQVDTFIPRLWKIPLVNGVLGQSQIGPVLGPKTCQTFPGCGALDTNGNPPTPNTAKWNWSPVTYAKRGNDEYVYFSMPSHGDQTLCAGACVYLFKLNDLRDARSEGWLLNISSNYGNGIPTNSTGTITVNGVTLTANTHFSTSGNRLADRDALIDAINNYTSYSAGPLDECQTSTSTCNIRITSNVLTNLNGSQVAVSNLNQTTLTNPINGSTGSSVAWGPTVNANAGLKAPGGTGGIVIDNNSTANGNGAAQIYFTQQAAGGNAIQASQSGLE